MITANQSIHTPKRHFWITESALSNWREKVKGAPSMGDEALSRTIDEQVLKAINKGCVEKIDDSGEPAQLVHLNDGTDPYFALVKKSSNPANGEFAVVTIMTPAQVEKKRLSQWGKFGLPLEGKKKLETARASEPVLPSVVTAAPTSKPERQTVGGEKPNSYLMSYMPFKTGAVDPSKRVYEEYGSAAEVEDRIDEVKIVPGTLRVFKELAIGYRIIDG